MSRGQHRRPGPLGWIVLGAGAAVLAAMVAAIVVLTAGAHRHIGEMARQDEQVQQWRECRSWYWVLSRGPDQQIAGQACTLLVAARVAG